MEVVERLTLEAAAAGTVLACEHRQRYEFAARLCGGARVLDLCCGSGYGSAVLASSAQQVVGVDNDAATIEMAQATIGRETQHVSFELADAVHYLGGDLRERFDVVVCFEGLEHLQDLQAALALLRAHAQHGLRVIASVPNSKMFREQNPFHITEFGYDEALSAFSGFPARVMLPQFLAEGSLITPPGAVQTEVTVAIEGRDEPAYANHFLFCVNFDADEVESVHHGRVQLNTSPIFNRWSEGLKHTVAALRRENARLARARLGKSGSAAASALAKLADQEAQMIALQERCRFAEARVRELELAAADEPAPAGGRQELVTPVPEPQTPAPDLPASPVVLAPLSGAIAARVDPGGDPNSWESRRAKAAEIVIPWIEQTVPLAGKTVLEYGCGNAAVSCAFAERAERVIGVDIDPDGIAEGNRAVKERDLHNVELELHPLDSIMNAVAARRGEIDVFLCYAVLEHLTIAERLALLRLAREVVKPDGVIVVCEAPNRLIYFDHHTAQMPFFHLLPEPLATEYYPRSPRPDFREAIAVAAQSGPEATFEALARWGRGVSFHEFEVVFGDLSRHVIASNYDPILFPERPVHPDEVILARYLERWRPDLAPVWSRYWLDLILTPEPVARRPSFLRPWSAETTESAHVGWTRDESLELADCDATVWARLPHPTTRLVVGTLGGQGELELQVRGETMRAPLRARIAAGPPDVQAFATFELPEAQARIALSASGPCRVVFVGYDD
jgi:2-polyprenyl-3-methyl-5-hydroxy-6-metoxy-1,4-benzoquinol methylase